MVLKVLECLTAYMVKSCCNLTLHTLLMYIHNNIIMHVYMCSCIITITSLQYLYITIGVMDMFNYVTTNSSTTLKGNNFMTSSAKHL